MEKELSKEEIIKKAHASRFKHKYSDEWIADAMDEYADQQERKKSIAFGKFLSRYDPHTIANGEWFYTDLELETRRLTTEQLYESEEFKKYFEEQNKVT